MASNRLELTVSELSASLIDPLANHRRARRVLGCVLEYFQVCCVVIIHAGKSQMIQIVLQNTKIVAHKVKDMHKKATKAIEQKEFVTINTIDRLTLHGETNDQTLIYQ